jgi:hypothetical protein
MTQGWVDINFEEMGQGGAIPWAAAEAAASEPLTLDVWLDACAAVCGDCSPELRDKYRRRAVEARGDAFLRTRDEIRAL